MHELDIYNMFRHEWQHHKARRIEIRPHTTRPNATEVLLFKSASDEAVVISTTEPVVINNDLREPVDGY